MPVSGEVYICEACDTMIKIINGDDTAPMCCSSEMQPMTDKLKLQQIPEDKNVCGAVIKCKKCKFKAIVVSDEGTMPRHHSSDMKITADRTSGEWDQIYKCTSCGQIVKITKEGCGMLHCCDKEVCVMDVPQVNELKMQIEIAKKKVHDKPFDDPYLICTECEREVKVIKMGDGKVICHNKLMSKRDRIRYYFQGGGRV